MTSLATIGTASPSRRTRRVRSRFNPAFPILAWLYAFLLALPLYFLVISSFKDNSSIFNDPFSLPASLDLRNFVTAWNRIDMGSGLMNSVITTVAAESLPCC